MSYLDSRIIILNSAHGISLNGTYKSNLLFTFNGLLTRGRYRTSGNVNSQLSNSSIILYN